MQTLHTWAWLLDRSMAKDVDLLRSKGFGACAVVPYFYLGAHEKIKGNVKKERKLIAFNRGSHVRVMTYSHDVAQALGIA